MKPNQVKEHIWVARCGCYSDIQKPSYKPWFYKPQWYWFGWKTLLPVSLGGDEWCRLTLVLGVSITGRIIIPLWGHKPDNECCPREEPSRIDDYIQAYKEIEEEQAALKARAKNIKKLGKKH